MKNQSTDNEFVVVCLACDSYTQSTLLANNCTQSTIEPVQSECSTRAPQVCNNVIEEDTCQQSGYNCRFSDRCNDIARLILIAFTSFCLGVLISVGFCNCSN